jgi:hypothetical protein
MSDAAKKACNLASKPDKPNIAAVGKQEIGGNVNVGPRTYNSKDLSFDRRWPFGPEFNPQ